jgi:hypothetical protein
VSGADNQQERPSIEAIPASLGSFMSGFALGEGSFLIVCRRRGDYRRSFKLSAAFNVSQHDRVPLDLFRPLDAGSYEERAMTVGVGRSIDFPSLLAESCPFSIGFRSWD